MGVIVWNGISSLQAHVRTSDLPSYESPEQDGESTHVPGRNGDIVQPMDSYKNTSISYSISINARKDGFQTTGTSVADWLYSASGKYARLEDSWRPDEFRLARFTGPLDIENKLDIFGTAKVSFSAMPQRFLKSGERKLEYTANKSILNPTRYPARPLITVKGTGEGTLTIGEYPCKISDIKDEIILDCDLMDAYSDGGATNRNSDVTIPDFPVLVSGKNEISISGGITSVSIVPRFWIL